ncbi:hypothetical protein F5I97DRAFT_1804144 [Phlebopus sp. FC_14]|nr:hypothetical protein F5I97DRAFT_1804144 [Phlebopus sp. FC_14]
MSMTTAATMEDSRSSSPETPETSDGPHKVAIHNELPSWYHSLSPGKNITVIGTWDNESSRRTLEKPDDEYMLQLGDLIEEHAYDESALSGKESPPPFPQLNTQRPNLETVVSSDGVQSSVDGLLQGSGYMVSQSQMRCTPVVPPPPAVRPRKRDPNTTPRRVVHPARESCNNLSILTPSIPESGTKSRVETQVRVTVDLAHASSSAGDPLLYDRVGSWKWLKLPPGTSTKKRTRREGKIVPAPLDILHLTATVACASAPHNRVLSCGSCRNREAKRVARKLAARVRPARSDSDDPEDGSERQKGSKEDTTSIIQFNCPEVLDFSTGTAVLPVRLTCYCRHHREKVGFRVHFTMMDHAGRVVGTGTTPPIMITDDHKSTIKSTGVAFNPLIEGELDWSKLPPASGSMDKGAPSKRKTGNRAGQAKKRVKPYDATSRCTSVKFTRETSVASFRSPVNSPSTQASTDPSTRSPTPSHSPQPLTAQPQNVTSDKMPTYAVDSDPLAGSFITNGHINPSVLNGAPSTAVLANGGTPPSTDCLPSPTEARPSPVAAPPQPPHVLSTLIPPQPMPFTFFNPGSPPPLTSIPAPKIHRLIPASGPTHGGIEVTILGENFHPAVQFNCIFGDVTASSTQRWSDNTLLCVLPPRSAPGVVAVWFEGFDKSNDTLPPLFTYTDESDRALMELALQVVGLKMTGKIEDAKNVALRIVGTQGAEDSQASSGIDAMMQAASSSYHDIRPLLFPRSGERQKFELAVIKFLSLLDVSVEKQSDIPMADAISHTTSSGLTLLHLAAFLEFTALAEFLIARDIDLDARDRNGHTALHFAALMQSTACAKLLMEAGADSEIVNALGKTPFDIAPAEFFNEIMFALHHRHPVEIEDDDGESHWGDVETDEDSEVVAVKRKYTRTLRRSNHRARAPDDEAHDAETPTITKSPHDTRRSTTDASADDTQAASFVDMIQRTLGQLHAPHGIIPNMPHLPLPHLPEMPTVPWGALPQIPMVFPVFVPMPGWPSFLSDKREEQIDDPDSKGGDNGPRPVGYNAARTAQELRSTWEKWMAVAIATATLRPPPTEAPPMYTPRELPEEGMQPVGSTSHVVSKEEKEDDVPTRTPSVADRPSRRVNYEVASLPTQEVESFGYVSAKTHAEKAKQKHDRMLVLFWLPILLMSLLWAFHNGFRFALHALKTTLSLKGSVRA